MTSAIDTSKPVAGSPTTQSVRDNFTAAKSEISNLQLVRAVRVASVNESTELFQACAVNDVPQIVQFNQVTFINPSDLSCMEFDSINNELVYKETGWYHVDMTINLIRKVASTLIDWHLHSQYKVPAGSFANFAAGRRSVSLDGAVANQKVFFSTSFVTKVETAGTRFRWMQTCTNVSKDCGIIAYPASGVLSSSAGAVWSSHKIGSL